MCLILLLTHGGREDDNPKDIHLLAAARTRLVYDVWGRSQLQVDCASFGVAVVGHHVNKVSCDGSGWNSEYGDQVCFVLKDQSQVVTERKRSRTDCYLKLAWNLPAGTWLRSGWMAPCFCTRIREKLLPADLDAVSPCFFSSLMVKEKKIGSFFVLLLI